MYFSIFSKFLTYCKNFTMLWSNKSAYFCWYNEMYFVFSQGFPINKMQATVVGGTLIPNHTADQRMLTTEEQRLKYPRQ